MCCWSENLSQVMGVGITKEQFAGTWVKSKYVFGWMHAADAQTLSRRQFPVYILEPDLLAGQFGASLQALVLQRQFSLHLPTHPIKGLHGVRPVQAVGQDGTEL